MTKSLWRVLAASTALLAVTATGGAASASAATAESAPPAAEAPAVGPYQYNFSGALLYSLAFPQAEPRGVNDWNCTPKAGTEPVVLVHGTFANQYDSLARMAPDLKAAGHCLYSFNYGTDSKPLISTIPGRYGLDGLSENGDELAAFADTVRERTGSQVVDMVGWSQGGTIITDVLKKEGGDGVDDVVTYGATHHGTTLLGLGRIARAVGGNSTTTAALGQAATDQIVDSEYIKQLTADGDTVPGVDYTVVGTRYDQVTTPYRSTFLEQGPGATVKNITLQDGCGIDFSDHLSMMYSPRAIDIAKRALHPQGSGSLRCLPNAPGF